MERNPDETFGATGAQGTNTGGMGSYGGTGAGTTGSGTSVGGADYSTGAGVGGTTGTTTEPNRAEQAKVKAQDAMHQVKDKARQFQSTLADRLDAGAEKLRQRSQSGQSANLAGATGTAETVGVASDEKMMKMQDSLARGMNKSADWLRNGDLKADIEKQVRENPGRTLLVALGLGYVLGKAFRGGSNR